MAAIEITDDSDGSSWTTDESMDEICKDCRDIDFERAFAQRSKDFTTWDSTLADKFFVVEGHMEFDPNCMLCGMLSDGGRMERAALMASSPPVSFLAIDVDKFDLAEALIDSDVIWLLCTNSENPIGDTTVPLEHALKFGWFACFPTSSAPKIFQPRLLSPRIDTSMMRSWLETCQQHHQSTCLPSVSIDDLVLIDCEEWTIRNAPPHARYTALSYVWQKNLGGTPVQVSLENFLLLPPFKRISKTIKDAVHMTLKLGLGFL
jgi:hypothetical protein